MVRLVYIKLMIRDQSYGTVVAGSSSAVVYYQIHSCIFALSRHSLCLVFLINEKLRISRVNSTVYRMGWVVSSSKNEFLEKNAYICILQQKFYHACCNYCVGPSSVDAFGSTSPKSNIYHVRTKFIQCYHRIPFQTYRYRNHTWFLPFYVPKWETFSRLHQCRFHVWCRTKYSPQKFRPSWRFFGSWLPSSLLRQHGAWRIELWLGLQVHTSYLIAFRP